MRLFRLVILLALAAIVAIPLGMVIVQKADPAKVLPATVAQGDPCNATVIRVLPDTVQQGGTFNVTVNFWASGNKFRQITLIDLAPPGWNATVDKTWCEDPKPSYCSGTGTNQPWFCWMLVNYTQGQEFTVVYKVTVADCNASLKIYNFSDDSNLAYFVDNCSGHPWVLIPEDSQVELVPPDICFAPPSIIFYGAVNGTNPQNQTLELFSSTPCRLNWNVTDDADYEGYDWLSENGENITSGNCTDVPRPVVLSVNLSGMPEGDYAANITIQSPEAYNSPQLVPVTLHMRETSILEAHVSFVGRGDPGSDKWIEPFEVWLFNSGTTDVVWQGVRTTNNTGWFNISDVVVGIYDIAIKNATCLSEVRPVTVSEGAGAVVDFGTLREGDADNDDWILIMDRRLLYNGWLSQEGEAGYNINCDFDRDGWLLIMDRRIMYGNWGESGDLVGY